MVRPIVKSGCTPYRWFARSAECKAWYRWAVGQVAAIHPAIVVIGAVYAGVTGSEADEGKAAIQSLIKAMKRSTGKVILIGDPPGQKERPLDCLLSSHASMAGCTTTWPTRSSSPGAGKRPSRSTSRR